jgi:hypothetical protein
LSVKERHAYYGKIVSFRTPSNSAVADSWHFTIWSSIAWAKEVPLINALKTKIYLKFFMDLVRTAQLDLSRTV